MCLLDQLSVVLFNMILSPCITVYPEPPTTHHYEAIYKYVSVLAEKHDLWGNSSTARKDKSGHPLIRIEEEMLLSSNHGASKTTSPNARPTPEQLLDNAMAAPDVTGRSY